ncbi:AAA family ATPase [Glycomyces sp. YM15]|uniref:AAA family ATPase n=1 Tax=Glycomyces sp. YM15 TaxID=2800446 RepID=UPI001964A012|nr:AAA family ATPase [Glycomyces sp. YM15]
MSFDTPSESLADVFVRGVELLGDEDLVRAADCFEHLLDYDPRAFDAWLGLHACGERQGEALQRMVEYHQYTGRLREETGIRLQSSFLLGSFVGYSLENPWEAWLAQMARLIEQREFERARRELEAVDPQDDTTRFLLTRCAFEQEDWERVLTEAREIGDGPMGDEAQLYIGSSLVHLQTYHEALKVLDGLAHATENPYFEAYTVFVRGHALQGLGRTEEAAQAYQRAYRLAPDAEGFAEQALASRANTAQVKVQLNMVRDEDPDIAPEWTGNDQEAHLRRAARRLDEMIGLEPVKQQINMLEAQYRMAALKKERGLRAASRPQHFVFTGPPGTGKTTVARIVGELLAGLGLLEHGKVVETQRGDLVGQHLGHTAQKTREKIEEAVGGVLFIDEAYSLAQEGIQGGDAFGDEALQEILTAAENRRDELVIVLAGYPDEIHQLLGTNPGLRSRFPTVVEFPSYSAPELLEIAHLVLDADGERLSREAAEALLELLETVVASGAIDPLGNARFAREVCRKAAARRDLRLIEAHNEPHEPSPSTLTSDQLTTIEESDAVGAFRELAGGLPQARLGGRRRAAGAGGS